MGWFKKFWKKARKWIGVVVGAVLTIVSAGLMLPALIGEAIAGAVGIGAQATFLGAKVSTIIGSAVTGAITGAVSSAVGGGDPLKGALGGFVGGLVGPIVSGGVGSMLGGGTAGQVVGRILGGAAGGVAGSAATGGNAQALLRGGLLGGAQGLASGFGESVLGLDKGTAAGLGSIARAGTSLALGPPQRKQTAPQLARQTATAQGTGPEPSKSAPQQVRAAALRQGLAPQSALAGALSVGGGMGYTPGAAVFGAGDSEKPRRNVWNRGSLRTVSEEG